MKYHYNYTNNKSHFDINNKHIKCPHSFIITEFERTLVSLAPNTGTRLKENDFKKIIMYHIMMNVKIIYLQIVKNNNDNIIDLK